MLCSQVALQQLEQQPAHVATQIAQEAMSLQRLRAEAARSAAAQDSGRLCNAAQHSMASSQPVAAKVSTNEPPLNCQYHIEKPVHVFLVAQSGGHSGQQHALCQALLFLKCLACVPSEVLCCAAG